jgi:hypothetical protein
MKTRPLALASFSVKLSPWALAHGPCPVIRESRPKALIIKGKYISPMPVVWVYNTCIGAQSVTQGPRRNENEF